MRQRTLKEKMYKTILCVLEELRNNIRRDISAVSQEKLMSVFCRCQLTCTENRHTLTSSSPMTPVILGNIRWLQYITCTAG